MKKELIDLFKKIEQVKSSRIEELSGEECELLCIQTAAIIKSCHIWITITQIEGDEESRQKLSDQIKILKERKESLKKKAFEEF